MVFCYGRPCGLTQTLSWLLGIHSRYCGLEQNAHNSLNTKAHKLKSIRIFLWLYYANDNSQVWRENYFGGELTASSWMHLLYIERMGPMRLFSFPQLHVSQGANNGTCLLELLGEVNVIMWYRHRCRVIDTGKSTGVGCHCLLLKLNKWSFNVRDWIWGMEEKLPGNTEWKRKGLLKSSKFILKVSKWIQTIVSLS